MGLNPRYDLAQRTGCETRFYLKGSPDLKLASLVQFFSEEQGTSVLAEVYESKSIKVLPGTYSLDGLAKRFDPDIRCEDIGSVLHVFDDRVLSLRGNALNYQFAFFKMPPNVDKFRNLLRERLRDEAFAPQRSHKSVIQEIGGGISFNADKYPLQQEALKDVQARSLIFDVANKYILSSVISFPRPEGKSADLEVWKIADAHWDWAINDQKKLSSQ